MVPCFTLHFTHPANTILYSSKNFGLDSGFLAPKLDRASLMQSFIVHKVFANLSLTDVLFDLWYLTKSVCQYNPICSLQWIFPTQKPQSWRFSDLVTWFRWECFTKLKRILSLTATKFQKDHVSFLTYTSCIAILSTGKTARSLILPDS